MTSRTVAPAAQSVLKLSAVSEPFEQPAPAPIRSASQSSLEPVAAQSRRDVTAPAADQEGAHHVDSIEPVAENSRPDLSVSVPVHEGPVHSDSRSSLEPLAAQSRHELLAHAPAHDGIQSDSRSSLEPLAAHSRHDLPTVPAHDGPIHSDSRSSLEPLAAQSRHDLPTHAPVHDGLTRSDSRSSLEPHAAQSRHDLLALAPGHDGRVRTNSRSSLEPLAALSRHGLSAHAPGHDGLVRSDSRSSLEPLAAQSRHGLSAVVDAAESGLPAQAAPTPSRSVVQALRETVSTARVGPLVPLQHAAAPSSRTSAATPQSLTSLREQPTPTPRSAAAEPAVTPRSVPASSQQFQTPRSIAGPRSLLPLPPRSALEGEAIASAHEHSARAGHFDGYNADRRRSEAAGAGGSVESARNESRAGGGGPASVLGESAAGSVTGLASVGGGDEALEPDQCPPGQRRLVVGGGSRRRSDASSLRAWDATDALTEDRASAEMPEPAPLPAPPPSLATHHTARDGEEKHNDAAPAAAPPHAEASEPVDPATGVPRGFKCAVCGFDFLGEMPPGHCTSCCGADDDATLSGGGWLCRSCYSAHVRSMFPSHAATPAERWLSSERSAVLAAVGVRAPPPTACPLHRSAQDPTLSLFCTEHAELVCAECVSEQHAGPGHSFVAASQAAATCRCVLTELGVATRSRRGPLVHRVFPSHLRLAEPTSSPSPTGPAPCKTRARCPASVSSEGRKRPLRKTSSKPAARVAGAPRRLLQP